MGGKNQFNSSLPASLSGYLDSKNIPINYIIGDGDRTKVIQRNFALSLKIVGTKVGTYESLNSQ